MRASGKQLSEGRAGGQRDELVPSPKAGGPLACSRDHKEPEWLDGVGAGVEGKEL